MKKNNDQQIILAMDNLDRSVRNLSKFGSRYDEHIDRAAMHGDDSRARKLIRQKISVYALADQLQTLKSNLELGACTAQVMSDLGSLPDAISGCKGLLAESPDFTKLGKSITRLFSDMERPTDEISKLNEILEKSLSSEQNETVTSHLNNGAPFEESSQFQAEYAAMKDRIKSKVASEQIASPKYNIGAPTPDIDYAGIIDDENKNS